MINTMLGCERCLATFTDDELFENVPLCRACQMELEINFEVYYSPVSEPEGKGVRR